MSRRTFETQLQSVEASRKSLKSIIEQSTAAQIPLQRAKLLLLIRGLTIASFILLAFVVLFQMFWKIRHPEYTVISDKIISILAVGVFAELVGVIGIIAKLLWQK